MKKKKWKLKKQNNERNKAITVGTKESGEEKRQKNSGNSKENKGNSCKEKRHKEKMKLKKQLKKETEGIEK